MKFSIIIPVYNAEKCIIDCIESVINQTYSDWEIILIDDGSTDSTGNICDRYAEKDSRIKVVHSENQGGYKARLLGNNYVTGDYVIGLDSDDMYEPFLLESVYNEIIKYDVDMVIFAHSELHITGEKTHLDFPYEEGKIYSKKEILSKMIATRDHALWDKAIKTDIYLNTQYIKTERKLVLDDDYLQVVPIVCNVESATTINKPLYVYRLDNDSKSHKVKEDNILDSDWVNARILEHLKQNNLFNEDLFVELMQSYCKTVYPRLKGLLKSRGIVSFLNSKINNLEFMKIVDENSDRLELKTRERILYKYASKGHLFWGVLLVKVK